MENYGHNLSNAKSREERSHFGEFISEGTKNPTKTGKEFAIEGKEDSSFMLSSLLLTLGQKSIFCPKIQFL